MSARQKDTSGAVLWRNLATSISCSGDVLTLDDVLDMTSLNTLTSLSLSTWMYGASALLLVGLVYYYIVLPINYVKDLSEVGFDIRVDRASRRRGRSRHVIVQELRRRRKVGNLPPVFPNGWFMLLESHELRPGQVKHVAALGENFAVFRTHSGVAHVLDAYCPHLGANMAVGGVVKGDCLECPFHMWQFRGEDGKCTVVPYAEKVPEFAKVRRWESCEVNTVVFVWYHAEGEAPTWRPEPVPQISSKEWGYRGRNEFFVNTHSQDISENGADVAHLSALHGPSLFAGSDLIVMKQLMWRFARHVWSATWTPNEQLQHTATLRLQHEIKIFNKIALASISVRAEQIGPGYVELYMDTAMGTVCILLCTTPIEPLLQKVVHRFFSAPLFSLVSNLFIWGESIMIERDIMVWNQKCFEDKPILVKEDKNIAKHRRWFNQFYSENSPRFNYVKGSIDW